MLIGIDASRANHPEKTGVEWYAWHVIEALKRLPSSEAHTWMLYANRGLYGELGEMPPQWHERPLPWSLKYLWTQVRLSAEMLRHAPDVLFVPSHVLPRALPRRSVVTIHDVGFFRHPELYSRAERLWQTVATRDMVRRATRILTVSEYSKQEIIQYCDVDPDRITVVYPGVDHLSARKVTEFEIRDVGDRYRIPGRYFLYVGRLETKKNILTLIEAFRRYKEDHGLGDPISLVLAGGAGDGYHAIQSAIERTGIASSIVHTGYVAEGDKAALLAGAVALVHPSWYEGFGFTPLEAMVMRCPVICSRVGSLPEVVGVENALWIDPADPETFVSAFERILRDEGLCHTLRERAEAWVARYTWEQTATGVLEVLTHWDDR